jgi:hypothetical protein
MVHPALLRVAASAALVAAVLAVAAASAGASELGCALGYCPSPSDPRCSGPQYGCVNCTAPVLTTPYSCSRFFCLKSQVCAWSCSYCLPDEQCIVTAAACPAKFACPTRDRPITRGNICYACTGTGLGLCGAFFCNSSRTCVRSCKLCGSLANCIGDQLDCPFP